MLKRIAQALLLRVYDSVMAVVCVGKEDEVLDVTLFDTLFGTRDMLVHPGAVSVCVICNHPEGRMTLVQEEIRNIRWIREQAGKANMHVYIFGEDVGLFEVDMGAILDYNGENAS